MSEDSSNSTFYELIRQSVICDNVSDSITSLLKKLPCIKFNTSTLHLAIENNDVKSVQFLLTFNPNLVFEEEKSASKLAWDLKYYECLAVLLEADAPYPENFDFETVTSNQNIIPVIRRIETFHKNIENNRIAFVEAFIEDNPWLKHAYDIKNRSALTIALKFKRFELFSLLLSRGFAHGIDRRVVKIQNQLNNDEKNEIKIANKKNFRCLENSHLNFILSVTKICSHQPKTNYFKIIKQIYDQLDQIVEVRTILKTLENDEELRIVFDFANPFIRNLDQHIIDNAEVASTGLIYIAAANYEVKLSEILGTLAYKFTHRALDLIHQYNSKPYKHLPEEDKIKFEKIVKHLHEISLSNHAIDPIIKEVFKAYPKERWYFELLVRVPYLLARYKNVQEMVKNIRTVYCKELLTFFRENSMGFVAEHYELINSKKIITRINSQFKYMENLLAYDFLLSKEKLQNCQIIFKRKIVEIQIVVSDIPILALCMLYQFLKPRLESSITNLHIISDFDSLESNSIEIQEAFKSRGNPYLIVYFGNDLSNESFQNFQIKFKNQKQIILIMSQTVHAEIEKKIEEQDKFVIHRVNFLWKDLGKGSQMAILKKRIIFQGESCQLGQLLPAEPSVCNDLLLNDLVEDVNIVVDKIKLSDSLCHKFYIPRKFRVQEFVEKEINANPNGNEDIIKISMNLMELIEHSEKTKVVIISDYAGSGKTTALQQIAVSLKDQFSNRWIILVNLNDHFRDFDTIKAKLKSKNLFKNFPKFIIHILKLKKAVEEELFLQLFRKGKVIILFDGFDEINQTYKELCVTLFKSFDKKLGNQLWITTRCYSQYDLEVSLRQLSCSFLPLTIPDQIEFLLQYWETEYSSKRGEEAKALIVNLSDRLTNWDKSDPIGIPLFLRITAEIFCDNSMELKTSSYYALYNSFIEKKLLSWLWDEKLAKIDQIEALHALINEPNIFGVHIKIALKYLFGSEEEGKSQDISYDEEKWPKRKLLKMGVLVSNKSRNPRFFHETFAEYFVAKHLSQSMQTLSDLSSTVMYLLNVITSKQYQMIRVFLNSALESFDTTKELRNSFNDLVAKTEKYDCLHIILEEKLETLIMLILQTIETAEVNLLAKILGQKMIAEKIEESGIEQSHNLYLRKINLNGSNSFQLAVRFNNMGIVEKLTDLIKLISEEEQKLLIENCNENYENIFHCTAKNYSKDRKFSTLATYLAKVLTKSERKSILMQCDINKNTILDPIVFNNSARSIDEIFLIIREVFDRTELKNLITRKNEKYGVTLLCVLAKNNLNAFALDAFWRNSTGLLDLGEQRKFLQEKDDKGRNALHLAIQFNKPPAVRSLLEIIYKTLKADSKTIIQELTVEGENIFHCAAWRYKQENMFSELWKCLLDKALTKADIAVMVQQKNKKLYGVFHTVVERNLDFILKNFMTIFKSFDKKDQRELLMNKECKTEKNILGVTVQLKWSGNISLFCEVLNLVSETLNHQDVLDLLSETDVYGSHVLHQACSLSHKNIIEALCRNVKKKLDHSQQQEYFCKKVEFDEGTIFHRVALNEEHTEVLATLIKELKGVFTNDEIKKLLLEKDSYGNNILHIKGDGKTLHEFLHVLNQFFNICIIRSFFTDVNKTKMNYLQIVAISNKKKMFHRALFDYLETIFEHDAIRNMLLNRDVYGNNVYHLAVLYNNQEICQLIWKFISKFFPYDQQGQLLISSSSESKEIAQITLTYLLDQTEVDYADNIKILLDFISEEA